MFCQEPKMSYEQQNNLLKEASDINQVKIKKILRVSN